MLANCHLYIDTLPQVIRLIDFWLTVIWQVDIVAVISANRLLNDYHFGKLTFAILLFGALTFGRLS
jgi:hypothetical protein